MPTIQQHTTSYDFRDFTADFLDRDFADTARRLRDGLDGDWD
jgi:hypothetical protein